MAKTAQSCPKEACFQGVIGPDYPGIPSPGPSTNGQRVARSGVQPLAVLYAAARVKHAGAG